MRAFLSFALAAALATAPAAFAGPEPRAAAAPVEAAVAKSLGLLQRSGDSFRKQALCASCHHQTLPLAAATAARAKGVSVDADAVQRQLSAVRAELDLRRDAALVHAPMPGFHAAVTGVLYGAAAAGVEPWDASDSAVIYVMAKQAEDGSWDGILARGSHGATNFFFTAEAIRVVDTYAPPALRREADARIARARAWLLRTSAAGNEALTGKLNGLVWSKARATDIAKARRDVAAAQHADGGWAQEPGLTSDAYATAEALLALHRSGLQADDPVYSRGVDYLLRTQAADGSWRVRSRALPVQPPIDAGFPYGMDQWISALATAMAAEALAYSLP